MPQFVVEEPGGFAALDTNKLSILIDGVAVLVDGMPSGDEPVLTIGGNQVISSPWRFLEQLPVFEADPYPYGTPLPVGGARVEPAEGRTP